MDPNALYEDMINLAQELAEPLWASRLRRMDDYDLEEYSEKCADLAGMILNLDQWLGRKGFLPKAWDKTAAPKLGPEYYIPVDASDLDPEVVSWFHSSMSDPIYALGSRLMAYGETLASEEELDALVTELSSYLDRPNGDDSAEELDRIADTLISAENLLVEATS